MRILAFFRDWMLPIAMILGVSLYYIYINIPALDSTRQFANTAVSIVQPTLIFLMLFLHEFPKLGTEYLRGFELP